MLNQTALTHNLSVVQDLDASELWRWFAHICSIPHPSYHEEAIAMYIVDWAKSKHLTVWRDEVGNVIIKKPATIGMENRTPIALQAHLDMVPQANVDTHHDFTKDPIIMRFSDDKAWIKATNTTLGADNGIGMASCLAVLSDESVVHPDIEVLLTMTEETGMVGAIGLNAGVLTAPIMVNTDTEEIGEIYVGCAGGVDADVYLPLQYTDNVYDTALTLSITGLKGGHSGIDIHKNRANAIKIMGRVLAHLSRHCDFKIATIKGGSLRNAIARESVATLALHHANLDKFLQSLNAITHDLQTEIGVACPNLSICHVHADTPSQVIANTPTIINLINALPSGVVRYSDTIADVVETSLSFGVLAVANGELVATLLVRSLTQIGKNGVLSTLQSIADLAGAKAVFDGDYVGWNYDPNSVITPITARLYADILGHEPAIKVIHAGLECGLIKKNYPDMDIVSIGPTIVGAHSPDEAVDVASVAVYWQLLKDILKNSPIRS
ncbi:aminoacyl-histidine dipeptidase [Moraxella oblonga]|uniref:aminoacyl-histidine dipeptidase n=1 Tax=Moraxella oblonga TaxID=200413 RepID=UPI000832B545|nr:aminoacyl-histidine dipeptidase [Moraxella oblonga]